MNTRPPLETTSLPVVLSITFNDDCSCFAVGLNTGFRIFSSETCTQTTAREFNAGIGLVQMMGKANYLGVVGGGRKPKFAANKLILWDEGKSKSALDISALTPVRGAQLSKERIVVVLQNSVRVYKFAKPPSFITAYETANNPLGLCRMSPRIIAFPGRSVGHVQVVEIATSNVSIIPAHSSAIRALQLSPDGELLATASETGTLIRVFSTRTCAKLAELRRGIDPAAIFSLAFNPPGTMLACTSDKSTLHVFDMPKAKRLGGQHEDVAPETTNDQGKWGILSKIPGMPRFVKDTYSFAQESFATGDEPSGANQLLSESSTLGTMRLPKGVIGWLDDASLLVVGAGTDARWEKFIIKDEGSGKRSLAKAGWKRYLADN
ncbi:WD40-repeat-containing domain protein [Triangularia verruculosa]|uniref:WD40-repeat-containing domain protein n=1 Tax=Triangularia verruculosa TaxID=2587418 RepID=A0AAN6XET0_9PEZI|nr:WD40-repeat-containing domain protein [Triangularia verruculosa]